MISIPLRYNLETLCIELLITFFLNFNSTKVQFGVYSKIEPLGERFHFNSTKVQFGEGRKKS